MKHLVSASIHPARSLRTFCRNFMLFAALLIACSVIASAQITSTVQGYVADPNGASVPGARVTITNEETGVVLSSVTADDGYYRIPDLLAGTYRMSIEKSGFKTVVRSGIPVTAKTVVGQNYTLELGAVTESVTVSEEGAQVETQAARINDVIGERALENLPMLGRTPLSLALTSPGITAKFESFGGQYCCDVFSTLRTVDFSSGGSEFKSNYTIDGVSMRFGDGPQWAMSFTPNPDALQELNVSTSASTAEMGSLSGPQIQLITKGGTNSWHGTGHYTFQSDNFNAVPFRSTRADVPDSYYRLFGGTLGGPIKKDRIFGFFAYEGRRAKRADSFVTQAETESFKSFVTQSHPNSIAALLLDKFPPLRYPTQGLVDLNGDGTPDIGEVTVDTPIEQGGRQLNGRVDYHFPNAKDRIYASYWYTRPTQIGSDLRPAFAQNFMTRVHYANVAHSRAFSPNVFNEIRWGVSDTHTDQHHSGAYWVPGIYTDDGLSLGNFAWSVDVWQTTVTEFGDTLSINRGKHGFKLGGGFTHREISFQSLIEGDNPVYGFASVFDFANDNPYFEERNVDVSTGKANKTDQTHVQKELSFFTQNTWQIRPNLTVNYGLRWEQFFAPQLRTNKKVYAPFVSSDQLNPAGITALTNRPFSRYFSNDWNNFSPRLSIAWDPTSTGKMSIRANFGILYDEVNALQLYNSGANPPGSALSFAGPDYGIPIVYGVAPEGTREFPPNPNLAVPVLNEAGGFVGAPSSIAGFANDLREPMVYDSFVGVQFQLLRNLMVFGNYRYRRTTNDVYADDFNRFSGDMVDGLLDRLNPNFAEINIETNLGKRTYHGLVIGANKRFSHGFSIDANYTYNNGRNNFGSVGQFADSGGTIPFDPQFDWARDDIAHVFTFRNVWDLPIFRTRTDWLGKILGGWNLSSAWNLQTGGLFVPYSSRRFGQGGDFNADGRTNDRPDLPAQSVPHSFGKSDWLNGALSADIFPLPDPSQPRAGTLPRDYFRGPGYARIDLSMGKAFRIKERMRAEFRAEAFNALNRINISRVERRINNSSFGRATDAFMNRIMQFEVKFIF